MSLKQNLASDVGVFDSFRDLWKEFPGGQVGMSCTDRERSDVEEIGMANVKEIWSRGWRW